MKKMLAVLLAALFFCSPAGPVYASREASAFLCEVGLSLYRQGRYDEALTEFKKALMVDANYKPALKYLKMIEQMGSGKKQKAVIPPSYRPTAKPTAEAATFTRLDATKQMLDLVEIQRDMVIERQMLRSEALTPLSEAIAAKISPPDVFTFAEPALPAAAKKKMKAELPTVVTLDESLAKQAATIEIEAGKSVILSGKNIRKFLLTEPDVLDVERKSPDVLLVTGKNIGYTYLHTWDDTGRQTTEWRTVIPRPEGPTYEDLLRREEERARNFRMRYSMDWLSYESGRRIYDLNRDFYSWAHSLSIIGPTPYGDIDSLVTLRKLRTSTDLTYFTLGLTNGQVGPFKGFTLRAFDHVPPFTNLTFPGTTIRGGMLDSPAFNNKLNYTVFWGKEGGGRLGDLSPTLSSIKKSYLEGINLSISPTLKQNYRASFIHGWGSERDPGLNKDGADLMGTWTFSDNLSSTYEVAYDSEHYAQLLSAHYRRPKLDLKTEIRNINKKFVSMTDIGWRQGELGGLFDLNYAPSEKINVHSSLDVYRDRLFPALDNPKRWNEDFDFDVLYQIDESTSASFVYSLQNMLGSLSQYRFQSPGVRFYKKFKFFRDIYTFANYYYQRNQSFTSPSSSYNNNRLNFGVRFSLIGDLYYYINREMNWLEETFNKSHSQPNAVETGVDWTSQIARSPFYGTFRFTFRDEDDTVANISLLSGEDYIEGYSELSYRPPSGGSEVYGSCRVRNIWAENPNVTKRVEASFNAGMRLSWDTGLRWESVGSVEGYVFRDLNSDGLRQRNEAPVEGLKVFIGKDKFQTTDLFGYYVFKGIRARKAFVTLDTSSLPTGFVLTVPATQEVAIKHHGFSRIDFGIISRSEISGHVFEDINGDGKFDNNDYGIQGVAISLENGMKTTTDITGAYSFPNASSGEHTITLDLSTLPIIYLPKTAIIKNITLLEGVGYVYDVPLKKIKE